MGNRGIIHDGATKTLLKRRWTTRAWIICVTEFASRHRTVMGPSGYTELFFLDEATAFAAGHRPCFECQRQRAKEFADAFATALGRRSIRAPEIDVILHSERLAAGHPELPLDPVELAALPDGTMVAVDGAPHLLFAGNALPWSFAGYGEPEPLERFRDRSLRLLTPPSTVAAFRAGFRPLTVA
jgi:hypothetical protein